MAFKHMRLLKYKVAIAHGARTGTVQKAWAAGKIDSNGKSLLFTRASSPAEPEPLSTTSRDSSSPKPRRPGITKLARLTAPSRKL